jgi:hypothetical protein
VFLSTESFTYSDILAVCVDPSLKERKQEEERGGEARRSELHPKYD